MLQSKRQTFPKRVDLHAPDTRVISQPRHDVIGLGTFKQKRVWTVEHVRKGASAIVEITVFDESLTQTDVLLRHRVKRLRAHHFPHQRRRSRSTIGDLALPGQELSFRPSEERVLDAAFAHRKRRR